MKRAIFILTVVCLSVVSCKDNKTRDRGWSDSVSVSVMVVGGSQTAAERNYVGRVASEKEVDLYFPLGGKLTKVAVRNGQKVAGGQILAQVDATSANSLYTTAKATLRQAEDAWSRMKPVYDEGGISEVRWVQMETDLEKARQTEISARKNLENCTLKAPFPGVVSCSDRQVGEELRPTEPFAKVLDMNRLRVVFSVPEQEVSLLSVGDRATAVFSSLGGKSLPLRVSDKSLMANKLGHTYQVYATITGSDKEGLLPDMVANVHVSLQPRDGITIPAKCIQVMPEGISVWVVSGGVASRRMVKTSEFIRDGVIISEGLFPGDTVVVDGMQKLYAGASVKAVFNE